MACFITFKCTGSEDKIKEIKRNTYTRYIFGETSLQNVMKRVQNGAYFEISSGIEPFAQ